MNARALLLNVLQTALPPLDERTALNAIPGLDSLAMVNLVLKLEACLDRELREDELAQLATVQDVENLLRRP